MLSDPPVRGDVIDISHLGIGLLTEPPLTHGARYALTFRIGSRTATCSATVAHVHQRPDGIWRAGLSFVEDQQLGDLERLVDELLDGLVEFS